MTPILNLTSIYRFVRSPFRVKTLHSKVNIKIHTHNKTAKAVVTGECSNNTKETGMVGILSAVLIQCQLWRGGRESRSAKWDSWKYSVKRLLAACRCAKLNHMYTQAHTYTLMLHTKRQKCCMSHTHTGEMIEGDLQLLKTNADSRGLCPWWQEVKALWEREGERRGWGARERQRECETRRQRCGRGVPEHDCTKMELLPNLLQTKPEPKPRVDTPYTHNGLLLLTNT